MIANHVQYNLISIPNHLDDRSLVNLFIFDPQSRAVSEMWTSCNVARTAA